MEDRLLRAGSSCMVRSAIVAGKNTLFYTLHSVDFAVKTVNPREKYTALYTAMHGLCSVFLPATGTNPGNLILRGYYSIIRDG